ncbi:hypothetical protein [Spiroplasma endosymbiont of Nebria brevicollis]|uniref:hypothetical protein n=1 Tax=Spiroplasma endosymbiont of Nebria brevicollis TaxID=3066284 RepID=UPI00313AB734
MPNSAKTEDRLPLNDDSEEKDTSNNEIVTTQTQQTNSTTIYDKLEALTNVIFFTESATAAIGNGLLLYSNKVFESAVPAAVCFITDGVLGAVTSLARVMMYNLEYQNKTLNNILRAINLVQPLLLDIAVIELNPLPLNPKLKDVWGRFIPAAIIGTLNSTLAIANLCYNKNNNDQQQLPKWKQIYNKASNILTNILSIIGVNLALDGVINMSQLWLNEHQNDKNINNVKTAFDVTIAGIGIVSGAVLLNNAIQLIKAWVKNSTENREPLLNGDIEAINNRENDFDTNNKASFLQTSSSNDAPDNESLDTERINSEECLVASHYDSDWHRSLCSVYNKVILITI